MNCLIPGYKLYRRDRIDYRGRGVALYLKDSIKSNDTTFLSGEDHVIVHVVMCS